MEKIAICDPVHMNSSHVSRWYSEASGNRGWPEDPHEELLLGVDLLCPYTG